VLYVVLVNAGVCGAGMLCLHVMLVYGANINDSCVSMAVERGV
jgi:hypothetical protein